MYLKNFVTCWKVLGVSNDADVKMPHIMESWQNILLSKASSGIISHYLFIQNIEALHLTEKVKASFREKNMVSYDTVEKKFW